MTALVVLGAAVTTALALTGLLVWARDRYNSPERELDRIERRAGREYRKAHPDGWPFTRPDRPTY